MVKKEAKPKKKTGKKPGKPQKKKIVFTTGKRKTAVARIRIIKGKGKITINSSPLDVWGNEVLRMWIREPIILAGEMAKGVNMRVSVKGGGASSQAEAVRVAIARGLVDFSNDKKLRKRYLDYDRNLLVFDSRRTEPHKPSRSRKGARRHKQRSKR